MLQAGALDFANQPFDSVLGLIYLRMSADSYT